MKKILLWTVLSMTFQQSLAQRMTPEILWELGRVSAIGLTTDRQKVIYEVTTYDVATNDKSSQLFVIPIRGGKAEAIEQYDNLWQDPSISPTDKYQLITKDVKIKSVLGTDYYPELEKSNVYIIDDLHYRHWDVWKEGTFSHLFVKDLRDTTVKPVDIMEGQPYETPMKPFGGAEDYAWNHDGTRVLYVTKEAYGKDYVLSTNTDILSYDIATQTTVNLSKDNRGYDTQPSTSEEGLIAWLQMDEPGYEADKNDIVILDGGTKTNLTEHWDGTVNSYLWSNDGQSIYFVAPVDGTRQLFKVGIPKYGSSEVAKITDGIFDITGLVGQVGSDMIVTRTDMNHAAEIYRVNLRNGEMEQLSHVNDAAYAQIKLSKVEKRLIPTTDGKEMLTWVIYPPDFDPTKKYPTLLYCQGGPQSALSQFYSIRWNFQLMAAHGYIVVAPNRRGMPGHGVAWNEQISGDWGGQNMQDYLSAIDVLSSESYVDQNRLGCVGASYGGYSVFYLAGIHEKRFKTFIAHDGVFNTLSMFGTTEELFFVLKDLDGNYWDSPFPRGYYEFNPIYRVSSWDTPIMIIQGGKDYRVPIGQGLEAFQAAKMHGLKSKLLYFPDENHWILTPQNGIIWQREFFNWLAETIE